MSLERRALLPRIDTNKPAAIRYLRVVEDMIAANDRGVSFTDSARRLLLRITTSDSIIIEDKVIVNESQTNQWEVNAIKDNQTGEEKGFIVALFLGGLPRFASVYTPDKKLFIAYPTIGKFLNGEALNGEIDDLQSLSKSYPLLDKIIPLFV